MLNAIRRAGKEKFRIQFDVVVNELQLSHLPDGTSMRIRWKRGSSTENRTMDRPLQGGKVVFNDAMTIIATLWYDGEDNQFLEKESTIQVLEVQPDSQNPIKHDSCTFPLEQHVSFGVDVDQKLVEFRLSTGGVLVLQVSSRCVDRIGRDSEEGEGSDRSSLNDYPFDWDEERDWQENGPALAELESVREQLEAERKERGGQLQDLHDEMVSLDEEVKICRKKEAKTLQELALAQEKIARLEQENRVLSEELSAGHSNERRGNQEELHAQIDELREELAMSRSDNEVLRVENQTLQSTISELSLAGEEAHGNKTRVAKLEKENKRLNATVSILQQELEGRGSL